MPIKLFLGVDGGGTKSRIVIRDDKGMLLGKALSGPASIRISTELAWNSIDQGINAAAKQAQIDIYSNHYEVYAGMGLAGCEVDTKVQRFLARPHLFKKLLLNSDGYCACLGAHDCQDGAIVTIGTGMVGFATVGPHVFKTSGWGFPQGDEGAGAWLGLEAARYTAQWLDGRRAATPLLKAIYARFKDDEDYFVQWLDAAKATDFATLAPIVMEYVAKSERLAVRLINRTAQEVNRIFYALQRKATLAKSQLNYCLFGGIAPFVQPWIADEFKACLTARQYDAVEGAVFMVQRAALGRHIAPYNTSNAVSASSPLLTNSE